MAAAASPITRIDVGLVARVIAANPRVQRLNLAYNAITDVDASIGSLASTLRALDLSHNRLRELGPEFGLLTRLHTLLAAGNAIEDVSGLAGCGSLQRVGFASAAGVRGGS